MKNNREVCYANDAGYAEFRNLPGQIKTGCPNTPALNSRYCSIHAPLCLKPQKILPLEDGSEPKQSSTFEGKLAAIITDKRITRSSTLYQVCVHNYNIHVCSSNCLTCTCITYIIQFSCR